MFPQVDLIVIREIKQKHYVNGVYNFNENNLWYPITHN